MFLSRSKEKSKKEVLNNDLITAKKLLIVDDSKPQRDYLAKILQKKDYFIIQAENGEEALSKLKDERPDLILIDVSMPGMSGLDLCEKIKSDPELFEIPVLFISSRDDQHSIFAGFKIGAADYIIKPFYPDEVLARVRTHLKLSEAMTMIREHSDLLEQMLDKRTKELIRSERQAAFGQLVQGIVHNLRGPLTNIGGFSNLIGMAVEKINLDNSICPINKPKECREFFDKVKENIGTIDSSTKCLVEMMDSLMKKSRSDQVESFEVFDLSDIIRQELLFLDADMWYKHKVNKKISLSKDALKIYAVPSMVSQVFQNIMKNACDALFDSEEPTISVRTGKTNGEVWFTVSDNGPGMDYVSLSRIFEPFYTTKPKEKTDRKDSPVGTGLGLYICTNMIEFHKGKIETTSQLEKGTTFKVILPNNLEGKENT